MVWKPAESASLVAHLSLQLLARGRAARRRDQRRRTATAPRSARSRSTTATSPRCTSPARRARSGTSGARSGRTSTATATTRAWSGRPAARTSSSPTRRLTWTRWPWPACAAPTSYQGQKCSAASRVCTPRGACGPTLRDRLVALTERDRASATPPIPRSTSARSSTPGSTRSTPTALAQARDEDVVVVGGNTDDTVGWFVDPTVLEVTDPHSSFMTEELFAPVLTAYVYDDADWDDTLRLVDDSTDVRPHRRGVRRRTRDAVAQADDALRYTAGNFYVNDKPTGSVGRPAAVRRRPCLGHERQGRHGVEPDPVRQPAYHQGQPPAGAPTTGTRTWTPDRPVGPVALRLVTRRTVGGEPQGHVQVVPVGPNPQVDPRERLDAFEPVVPGPRAARARPPHRRRDPRADGAATPRAVGVGPARPPHRSPSRTWLCAPSRPSAQPGPFPALRRRRSPQVPDQVAAPPERYTPARAGSAAGTLGYAPGPPCSLPAGRSASRAPPVPASAPRCSASGPGRHRRICSSTAAGAGRPRRTVAGPAPPPGGRRRAAGLTLLSCRTSHLHGRMMVVSTVSPPTMRDAVRMR